MKLGVICDGISRELVQALKVMDEFNLKYAELQYVGEKEVMEEDDWDKLLEETKEEFSSDPDAQLKANFKTAYKEVIFDGTWEGFDITPPTITLSTNVSRVNSYQRYNNDVDIIDFILEGEFFSFIEHMSMREGVNERDCSMCAFILIGLPCYKKKYFLCISPCTQSVVY